MILRGKRFKLCGIVIFMNYRDILEGIIVLSPIILPLFFVSYFMYHDQVYGVDSWYWLKVTHLEPFHFYTLSILMWFSVYMYFMLSEGKLTSKILIASLFLINLFSLRFLEVEFDDYVFYLLSFTIILFCDKFFGSKFRKVFSILIVLFYVTVHKTAFFFGSNYIAELWRTPITFAYILPSIFLLFENRMYKEMVTLLLLVFIFMTPKFVTNALPVLIFSFFLDLVKKDIKINYWVYLPFTLIFIISMIYIPIVTVRNNNLAFEKYCDKETMICNNIEEGSWHYGHYFTYLGYYSNNPDHWGVCMCKGEECLRCELDCGR